MPVLIKPTSSRCNLNCSYCFYLSKAELYPWSDHPKLTLDTFQTFLDQYVPMSAPMLSFMWQGGEPTMMGLPFFEDVVRLQMKAVREAVPEAPPAVSNAIQTNATMLNDDWARFFKWHNFLVRVSLAGPPEWHDNYRVDWSGRPTHERVMAGIAHLRRHDVPFNVLTVINQSNVGRPLELLHWLLDQGFEHLQFIPCAEVAAGHASAAEGGITDESLTPEQYGKFLVELFDAWREVGIEKARIRWFDNLVQMLWGFSSEACQLARTCGYLLLEHNGDMYPCDFFVESEWLLGNIHDTSLADMVQGERFRSFAGAKPQLHDDCRECPWLTLCYGECPKYRVMNVGEAENSLPFFCDSFKQFFEERYSSIEEVAVGASRPLGLVVPGGAMPASQRSATTPLSLAAVREDAKVRGVGRNGPCPCGSGAKFKRCCGA